MSTIIQKSIDSATAQKAIEGAVAKAKEIGIGISVAIADQSGILKAFHRTDDAPLISLEIAQDKAHTSSIFGMPTHAVHDFIKDDPPLLHGIVHTPRLVVFGGGYPITEDGAIVGAIGISGGHYSQDVACAVAGLAAIGVTVE